MVKGVDRLKYIQWYQHGKWTSITTSTTRSICGYLLTFSTWRLSLTLIPLYYLSVMHRSQRGYFSLEVQSCMFNIQFYITDIFITFLDLVILSFFVKASCWSGREQGVTLESEGCLRTSPIAWWFWGFCWHDTLESALLLLLRRNCFAVPYRQVDT